MIAQLVSLDRLLKKKGQKRGKGKKDMEMKKREINLTYSSSYTNFC
jgi:hypothetical protein